MKQYRRKELLTGTINCLTINNQLIVTQLIGWSAVIGEVTGKIGHKYVIKIEDIGR
jgi:hypothetical protein